MHVKSFKMAIPRSLFLVALLGLVCAFAAVVRADDGIPPSYEYGNEKVALKSKRSLLKEGLKYMVLGLSKKESKLSLLKERLKYMVLGLSEKESKLSLLKEGLKYVVLGLSEKESKISELEQELDALRTHKEETEDTTLTQLKIVALQSKLIFKVPAQQFPQLKIDSALSKVRELESQVQSLQEECDKLRVEADLHANRAKTAEETATRHLTEKEKATKALEDQKIRLQKAERGLQIAEAAMLKATAEAEEKAKKLDDLHKAWLPPWASTHAETLTKSASGHSSTHAHPVVKNLQRMASSKADDAHEYICHRQPKLRQQRCLHMCFKSWFQ